MSEITSTQALIPFNRHEPISGYVAKELIGRGGYGEVWKADAPGGLCKAIKYVFGGLDSKRASREMRSSPNWQTEA